MIAESYERIHRSNLVGMGIVPLQYKAGETAETLGLTGSETFSIELPAEIQIGQEVDVKVSICFDISFNTVHRQRMKTKWSWKPWKC